MIIPELLSVLVIAVGLSADCFAVAIGVSASLRTINPFQVFRTSTSFGLFQALMPVAGWLIGQTVVDLIADYDHWVAFALLLLVGSRMLWESFRSRENCSAKADATKGFLLLTLSVATSIDALAVGLSFAFLEVDILSASLTIGITAFLITGFGFLLGRKMGQWLGKRAEALGGIILIAIGVRIIFTHIM